MSKYTELMLDVACGDASEEDAYIEQAIGKINVSNAIFALESKIAELPEDGEFLCVQEAADAGLPANKAEATAVSCEAVRQQVVAFYDLVLNTAKKVKEACDKDMKLLIAFGKKNGIAVGDNFESFMGQLGEKVNGAAFSDKKFLKGKSAVKLARTYARGMRYFMNAYGLGYGGNDSSLRDAGFDGNRSADSIRAIENALEDGGKSMAVDRITSKDSHYTATPKSKDFVQFGYALYVILNVSKITAETMSSNKKAATANVAKVFDNDTAKSRKITRSCEGINDDIKKWTSNLTAVTGSITTAFGDSVYAINEAK